MPSKHSKKRNEGKFLPQTTKLSQGHPTPRRPFTDSTDINNRVLAAQGMAAPETEHKKEKGLFINFDVGNHLQDINTKESGELANTVSKAVKAAIEAAILVIVKAVNDACLPAIKEEVNPHLLRLQYSQDILAQQLRRDNLRITGMEEGAEIEGEGAPDQPEESEEMLLGKVVRVANKAGVEITKDDISECYRLGKKSEGKSRQIVARFSLRRKRDAIYAGRFKLKNTLEGVYINEDLTPMRYAVLKAAKACANVQRVSTQNGTIVCKLEDDTFKKIMSPDDLFDIGLNTIDYQRFKLHYME